jgi:uncharacterized protein YaeQ
MDIGIKNDEQLIKMATIIQRALQTQATTGGELMLTDAEKAQIMAEVEKIKPQE